jgi:hypothetical protein
MAVHPTGAWAALIVGVIGYVIVALWTVVGLTRGAWLSLEGRKPCFADFTRWDRPASARLLGSGILLAIVIAVAGAIATLIGAGLGKLNEALSVIPMIVVAIFYIWLLVSQKFLIQVSLLGTANPTKTIGSGVNVVNPSWWMVLWLVIIEGVVHTIGGLFSYGGLLVVVPLVLCISTAAFRQFAVCDLAFFKQREHLAELTIVIAQRCCQLHIEWIHDFIHVVLRQIRRCWLRRCRTDRSDGDLDVSQFQCMKVMSLHTDGMQTRLDSYASS